MTGVVERYLAEIEWQQRKPPEINRRRAPLFLGRGEAFPHYELETLADGSHVIAQVRSMPILVQGRVIYAERDLEFGRHVIHVGLALSGLASWPLLWRLDPSRLEYEEEFRFLVTPGSDARVLTGAVDAGIWRIWRSILSSKRLHVHLIDTWDEDDERLPLLQRGRRVEIYGPVAALAAVPPEPDDCEILFSELDPPECWCVHPLSIKSI